MTGQFSTGGACAALLIAALSAGDVYAEFDKAVTTQFWRSIARIQVQSKDGQMSQGSAVVVAPGKLVTNCHVTRDAKSVLVSGWNKEWSAKSQVMDVDHDVCVLTLAEAAGTPVDIAARDSLKVGDEIATAGFPAADRMAVHEGYVKGLFDVDGARVIQGTAHFYEGESGGALFDKAGKLVGVLSFYNADPKQRSYFAMPAEWVKPLLAADATTPANGKAEAFWERDFDQQPFFLQAISFENHDEWAELLKLGEQWTQKEPGNAEAWLAVGKAHHGMKRPEDALIALRKAVSVNPKHSESWLALAGTYRENGDEKAYQEAFATLKAISPPTANKLEAADKR